MVNLEGGKTMTLTNLIQDALRRAAYEATRGIEHTFHRVMTQADRDAFDAWLVRINHVLASEAGTQETRFRRFIQDVMSRRYKGEMP